MKPLDQMLQCGQKVKVFYNEGNINNQVRHIRAVVDGDYIVYRVWSRQLGWIYHIVNMHKFQSEYEKGYLS